MVLLNVQALRQCRVAQQQQAAQFRVKEVRLNGKMSQRHIEMSK